MVSSIRRKTDNWKCVLKISLCSWKVTLVMKNVLFCILMLVSTAAACRLWGVIAQQGHSLGNDSDNYALISEELRTYYQQGALQPQGWSLGFYREGRLTQDQTLFRSGVSTDRDSVRFASAVGSILSPSEDARLAIGHCRTASSGAADIPDPHPFLFFRDSVCYSLVHNGTIDKAALMDLLTENGADSIWLKNNPPHTYGNGDWQSDGFPYVVDSELLLLWFMKNLEESGDILTGLARATTRLKASVPSACQKNFILSDGKLLYISGGNGCLYYRFGATTVTYGEKTFSVHHQAVMTEPPSSGLAANLGWTSVQDHQLVILSPSSTMIYSSEALLALSSTPIINNTGKNHNGDENNDGIHLGHHMFLSTTGSGYATLSIYSLAGKRLRHSVLPVCRNQQVTLKWFDSNYSSAPAEGMALYVLKVGNKELRGIIPAARRGREFGLRVEEK